MIVDPAERSRPRWRTADWGYVRLHRGNGSPDYCYTDSQLRTWARHVAAGWSPSEDVYCYFNNDPNGCAPANARRFAVVAQRAGLRPSRVPGWRETPITAP